MHATFHPPVVACSCLRLLQETTCITLLLDGTIELGGVIHDVLEMDRDSTTPTALWLGRRMIGPPRQEAGTYREGGVSAS